MSQKKYVEDYVYQGCGNTFIIHHLSDKKAILTLKQSISQLKNLAQRGIEAGVDSIMVISGDPFAFDSQGYHVTMDVFEPNAFNEKNPFIAWSTMCGNGVRSVAQYLHDHYAQQDVFVIKTGSGNQTVVREGVNWRVHMGKFIQDKKIVSKYISKNEMLTLSQFQIEGETFHLKEHVHVGLHYQDEHLIDGEPHAVVFATKKYACEELKEKAMIVGEVITNNLMIFPQEINTSLVSIDHIDEKAKKIYVYAATYERNIYYVTQACGTAATVIGSLLFEEMGLNHTWSIIVHMPGGDLVIKKDEKDEYYLIGDAVSCKKD
ncbi:hypothetical protein KKG22_01825 [Patescibacteria group bacterium]|nr:hypothetical protein [Patescibacteria group bacterium]MBU1721905.1 hypothetical protein [Patescibacteria group bacterium]MBU1900863.1 hypothetical protein [Patescibacteria group bacterium]